MTGPDPRLLLTIDDAAALFGIPRRTLYRWVAEGRLLPSDSFRGRGCKKTVAHYRLEEIAHLVATRHAEGGQLPPFRPGEP